MAAINPIKEITESLKGFASPTPSDRENEEDIARANCRNKGGRWDEATKTCIMPKPKVESTEEKEIEAPPGALETFTHEKTGRAAGIVSPSGTGRYQVPDPSRPGFHKPATLEEYNLYRQSIGLTPSPEGATFLGLSPEDVEQVAAGERERVARPVGTAPVGTQATLIADAQRKLRNAAQVGIIDFATASQLDELGINWKEALLSGAADVVPAAIAGGTAGFIGGAITGAGVGSTITAPAGALAVGTITAIAGFYRGVNNNIKAQKSDLISGKRTELKQRQRALQN